MRPHSRPGQGTEARAGGSMNNADWMNDAACRGMDGELFFPIGNQPLDPEAGAACQRCPVASECLTYSLRAPGESVADGYWAGMSEDERRYEKRRRNRHLTAVAS